jgi:uncharacterized protein (DUF362 family)
VIRVGLGRTEPSYAGVAPPFHPADAYPELQTLTGGDAPLAPANPAYAAVRAALAGLGLDSDRFGTPAWNPLGALVGAGRRIVLKPNFIRHWNPSSRGSVDSVITHGSILRAVSDYAFLAVGPEGEVEIAEAPQQDCDFPTIRRITGLDEVVAHHAARDRQLIVIDLRREAVRFEDGIIVSRSALPGDPRGYRVVDLGRKSFFEGSGLDPNRFRGADYDPGPTSEHHLAGHNQYLLSETVLSADLVVNLPKLKTHKKTGVTLALKNLVGINGDKNWLPHHTLGRPEDGGDEIPGGTWIDLARSRAIEWARPLLQRGAFTRFFRAARRMESSVRGEDFVRSGNWHGNRTTWRMCLDLNRCLYYSDAKGLHLDAPGPVRTVLSILDGVVAGESSGPLAPDDVPLGVVLAATDPVALDLAAVKLMGFDARRIPKVWEAIRDAGPRITSVRQPSDIEVTEVDARTFSSATSSLDGIRSSHPFVPHMGWRGAIEGSAS